MLSDGEIMVNDGFEKNMHDAVIPQWRQICVNPLRNHGCLFPKTTSFRQGKQPLLCRRMLEARA